VPQAGNQFRMFESLYLPSRVSDGRVLPGWFSKVTLPAELQGWFWGLHPGGRSTSLTVPTGPYESATLMIPEPGTVVLLVTRGVGPAAGTIRRRAPSGGWSGGNAEGVTENRLASSNRAAGTPAALFK